MTSTQTQDPSNQAPGQGEPRRVQVLICGGGISALALAAWLEQAGVEAMVLDANSRPGGVIGSVHQDGFIFERGPNTVLNKYPSFDELVGWAGLEREIIRVPLRTQARHVWLKGALRQVPAGPLSFLTTPLLPASGKLALLREPFVKRGPAEESVADFVRRRLGPAWLNNLITPMVSGVWAGDPEQLSITRAFPIMKEMELQGGSLLRGALMRMRARRREAAASGRPPHVKSLVSFPEGLDQMPRVLAKKLGERYQSSTRLVSLKPLPGGEGFSAQVQREGQAAQWLASRLVIITSDAAASAGAVENFDREAAQALRSFPYNRLVVVGLGLRTSQAPGLPGGFGFLVPRGQGVRMLGAIVNSNFLPGRAPQGCAALTIFIGGELDRAAFDLDDDELLGSVQRDLRRAVGWNGQAQSVFIERWPRAIPQYDMRHAGRLTQIEAAEERWPGLHLAGNWRGGVSIGDRIEYARTLADKLIEQLTGEQEGGRA